MVIEVVGWKGASKTHAMNQDRGCFTLCGLWVKEEFVTHYGSDHFPTCRRCSMAVMKS